MPDTQSIERHIIIGAIVSTEFLQGLRPVWDIACLQSTMAKRLASWCIAYYDEYDRAPFRDIEGIYFEKLRSGTLSKEIGEEIEQDILPSLSDEYARMDEGAFNSQYILDRARAYFRERKLLLHSEEVRSLVEHGELEDAELEIEKFSASAGDDDSVIELSSPEALPCVVTAFNQTTQRVVTYPGALGVMLNDQLVRGGFVGFLAPEKRGKTFWLMDIALRGVMRGANVAFFQAGDMTEAQQIRRICMYLARKSDLERYCGEIYVPVRDCLLNQLGECNRDECDSSFELFTELKKDDDTSLKQVRGRLTHEHIVDAFDEYGDVYKPCYNCDKYMQGWGSVWYKKREECTPLGVDEAQLKLTKFFDRYKKKFKLSTHVNGTLSVKAMRSALKKWKKEDGFEPEAVILDYADLLVPNDSRVDYRHQQNSIWRDLRGLTQELDCLLATATQADAASYDQDNLRLKNFSEDKRKYSHVTAMYALDQDKKGREKKIGLMRINELMLREGEFSPDNEVFVLQSLQMGRPFMGSFK